ncbi:MAG: SAM-dependent methyltransferase [Candidatus Dadabacteria bacterium]|nr:hypothetical protein [Bryobacterales bacterium]MDE0291181.1 SAM-dependent methyltransferase [Candidatus Dadabacteria bacterium]
MPVSSEELRPFLQAFDFQRLFVEGLGWDHYVMEPFVVRMNERDYALKPIAEKAGFAVYECIAGTDNVPQYPVRRGIESEVVKRTFEHLIIYTDPGRQTQVWQWVKRETGKPSSCREYAFTAGSSGDHLLQRLQGLFVSLDEEPSLNITHIASRVRAALDIEKVTKRFYERFRTELTAFGKFIEGITAQGDRDWYASLMLNRMMFVYFIQKKGFLDGDADYLRNRLHMVQRQSGDGRFQHFYRLFLLRLFHEGLGQLEAQRAPDLAALLGQVPFLNGGLFDQHELERDNPLITIPDEAFERVFDFFDGYRWHLDERPYREDNEINPDVLGYIFEKYVNQKQMGAYYTKEDITGYISCNTVIPFLFDAAKTECPEAFEREGSVWCLLRDDPDRYIYPAIGHGVTWTFRRPEAPKRLGARFDLPEDVSAGIDDVSKRGGWNAPAPNDYALPTETWREIVARRQRFAQIRTRLALGEVHEINDLITLNLDIERFAKDVIAQAESPELLHAFWQAVRDVSVLDPTCGSGAFLFAALNVLEPLYTACMEGMRGFLDDAERIGHNRSTRFLEDFQRVLAQVDEHPSERYFILKSIVLNNLYGVDVMQEAVEICKLRLFLKLVAQLEEYHQIEPLPDIDFNVRSGNTLVGFTSLDAVREAMTIGPGGQHRQVFPEEQAALDHIEEEAEIASASFNQFRQKQTTQSGEVTSADKQALRDRFRSLDDKLDRCLASEYGVEPGDTSAFEVWHAGHQPFHWFVEFYGILHKGGFDVVIGNPPYVEYRKVREEYQVKGFATERCGNLYAMVIERSYACLRPGGRFGMIVQLSYSCTDRMEPIQRLCLSQSGSAWLSHFDDRPAKLFEGLEHIRATIAVSAKSATNGLNEVYATAYNRWYTESRAQLFETMAFDALPQVPGVPRGTVPKLGPLPASSILKRIAKQCPIRDSLGSSRDATIYFHNAPQYWVRSMDFAPYFWNERDGQQISTQVKTLRLAGVDNAAAVVAALNSSLFYWWFLLLSDCRHLNLREIESFPLGLGQMAKSTKRRLTRLADELMESFKRHSKRKRTHYRTTGKVAYDEFDQKPSKPIVDEIDRVLAEHYGFTDEELDFIINYDIKYRMGRDYDAR